MGPRESDESDNDMGIVCPEKKNWKSWEWNENKNARQLLSVVVA